MQDKFWEYHNELFINQPNYPNSEHKKYAENIGLDVNRFKRSFSESASAQAISDGSKMTRKLKLDSTPTFYIIQGDFYEKLNLTTVEGL